MPSEHPPILEYSRPRTASMRFAWQSILAAFGGLVFIPFFTCLCGHLNVPALSATVPTAFFAAWGAARSATRPGRIFAWSIAAAAMLILLKNLLDVAWWGHNPLFP